MLTEMLTHTTVISSCRGLSALQTVMATPSTILAALQPLWTLVRLSLFYTETDPVLLVNNILIP